MGQRLSGHRVWEPPDPAGLWQRSEASRAEGRLLAALPPPSTLPLAMLPEGLAGPLTSPGHQGAVRLSWAQGFWLEAETGLLAPLATPPSSPHDPGASAFPRTSPGTHESAAGSRAWACSWLALWSGTPQVGWPGWWVAGLHLDSMSAQRGLASGVWPAKAGEGADLVSCKDRKHLVGLGSLRDTKDSESPVGARHLLHCLPLPSRACDWTLRSCGRACSRVAG